MSNMRSIYDRVSEECCRSQHNWLAIGGSSAWDYNADDDGECDEDRQSRYENEAWRDLSWCAYDAQGEYIPRSQRK